MSEQFFYIEGINPQPWTASEGSAGRKDGKFRITFYKAAGLEAYQAGVKEEMQLHYPEVVPRAGVFALEFWFWRQLETTELDTRKGHRNQADATNMQKALEDALQGILYTNDRNAVTVCSHVVDQQADTKPRILIRVFDAPDWYRKEKAESLWDLVVKRQPRQAAIEIDPNRGFEAPDDNCF